MILKLNYYPGFITFASLFFWILQKVQKQGLQDSTVNSI
jgi:hypothetical protein